MVAEKKYGRPIAASEVVHHINLVKTDNRPENLVVTTPGIHRGWHARVDRLLPELLNAGYVAFSEDRGYHFVRDLPPA